jgi:hypothetical protein
MKEFNQSYVDSLCPDSEDRRRLRQLKNELARYDYYECSDTEAIEEEIREIEERIG